MRYSLFFISFGKIKYHLPHLSVKSLSSKVPLNPIITLEKDQSKGVKIDRNTLALLERLSLVKYNTPEGVKVLEDSINFANKILHIDTDGIKPLYSVLENENLSLRTDEITQGNCQKDILKNASLKEDDYFVAPIGNIPLHEVEVDENNTTAVDQIEKQNEI
ncbi:hypothetical protein K1T71_007175 [Dendrolimus kikuchii]|uniref:Uncharacterized protein n=1 Tax=Dendrolimus kikuchii TaxID=765133 RepID=A0ACC1CZP5_9NEOP|nr:hypothetical protein K1T71_007175 [Dendrolimus kikuchii]